MNSTEMVSVRSPEEIEALAQSDVATFGVTDRLPKVTVAGLIRAIIDGGELPWEEQDDAIDDRLIRPATVTFGSLSVTPNVATSLCANASISSGLRNHLCAVHC